MRPAVVSLFVREVMIFVISDGTIRFLSLRQTCASLRRRAGQGFALSLLRLPKADGIAVQRRRILSARKHCADGWRGEELPSSVSQRLRRFLPFLPRLRIVAMVGARTPSSSDRRGGRSLRRSGFPDARTGGVVRTAAQMACASASFACQKPGKNIARHRDPMALPHRPPQGTGRACLIPPKPAHRAAPSPPHRERADCSPASPTPPPARTSSAPARPSAPRRSPTPPAPAPRARG